jgi:hypothetical protein
MQTSRTIALALAVTGLAACSQTEQKLPFDPSSVTTSTQTVTTSGGALSLPAGASLTIGAGALGGSASIGLATATTPGSVAALGAAAGASFAVTGPAGTTFNSPLIFEQAVGNLTGADAWLTSYVVTTGASSSLLTDVDVDASNGALRARLSSFGTLTPVVPAAADQFSVTDSVSAALLDAPLNVASLTYNNPVKTISQDCGLATSAGRCTGIRASATGTLLSQFSGQAKILRPTAAGTLTLTGDPRLVAGATASGSIEVRAVLRVKRPAGNNASSPGAASVRLRATLTANANTRVYQAANTDVLTISGATVTFEPSFGAGGVPVTFTINPVDATHGAFRFNGTVNLGNGTSGDVVARFPFNIGF